MCQQICILKPVTLPSLHGTAPESLLPSKFKRPLCIWMAALRILELLQNTISKMYFVHADTKGGKKSTFPPAENTIQHCCYHKRLVSSWNFTSCQRERGREKKPCIYAGHVFYHSSHLYNCVNIHLSRFLLEGTRNHSCVNQGLCLHGQMPFGITLWPFLWFVGYWVLNCGLPLAVTLL